MFKSTIRFASLFVVCVLVAAAAASVAFIITENVLKKNSPKATEAAPADATYVMAETPKDTPSEFEYYLVRLDGNNLNVYAFQGGEEQFLYNTTIYQANLSTEDIGLLTQGVELENASALTEFIENYTS